MDKRTCIHFNGLMNNICKANHDYITVATALTEKDLAWHNENYPNSDPSRTGIAHRVPCLAENNIHTCPDFRTPTDEELAERDKQITAAFGNLLLSRQAITNHLKENDLLKKSVSGQIECPICQGKLSFSYAGAYNKHIHARCNTPNCVNWME